MNELQPEPTIIGQIHAPDLHHADFLFFRTRYAPLKTAIHRLVAWMKLERLPPELALAQFMELRRQVPLLYALLIVNSVAVAYTHRNIAPLWMTAWIPGALIAVSIARYCVWNTRSFNNVSADRALEILRRTTLLGFLVAAVFVTWALMLSSYAGDREQAHIAIYIAVTVIGCIFCLFPLPQTAVTVTATVTIPYLISCISLGDPIYTAIAANILLVTLVMMKVLINNHRSFTELVRLNGTVTALSRTDPLTGLPNRRHFFAELDSRFAARAGGNLYVGVLDLDRFKAVNDAYGHATGDALIRAIGDRLQFLFAGRGLLARLGGDEFAFLTDLDHDGATALAHDACGIVAIPVPIDGVTLTLGASCGLAARSDQLEDTINLYRAADYALYASKTERRGEVTHYSTDHARSIREDRALESALQSGDLESELSLVVQPIVEGRSLDVTKVEVLARWNSPTMGAVSPATFIPLAERAGMIHRMTLILFGKALQCAQQLPVEIDISFNLSANDLVSPDTISALLSMIRASSVASGRLVFELTETALMRDFNTAEASIRLLRATGARIALDDFGSGFSSLEYLRHLPIDKIKIDRGFVSDMEKPGGRDMLAGIVALCERTGMKCIVEGVETATQFHILWELGCRSFQGYYFARPMPIADFDAWNAGRTIELRHEHA